MKRETIKVGDKELTFETGRIAKQANAATLMTLGDTVMLVTAVADTKPKEGKDFFPLTVEYRERFAAGGRIPGGYLKREARPGDHETLNCRVIDRSIRPLFPKSFKNETQVFATLLSADPTVEADALALIGACMSLHMSDIPWSGPAAGIRVAQINGELVAFPNRQERDLAQLEMVVAYGPHGLAMVEGKAKEIPEETILDALDFAQREIAPILDLMKRWREEAGLEKMTYVEETTDEELVRKVTGAVDANLTQAVHITEKKARNEEVKKIIDETMEELGGEEGENKATVKSIVKGLHDKLVRKMTAEEGVRIDGRSNTDIRPIWGEVSWLPRAHGSAIFTRGQTQAMVSCTLGSKRDEQWVDTLYGEDRYHFLLHYNFPSYSVGEVRPIRGPGRREIGHGMLAHKALEAVLPEKEDFPYAIRVVSDISESNGSSSMATVCGGCLSMMDAGVKISAPVAGIAMGLIQEGDNIVILSDILGDEDHLGDMDFKVAGSSNGITAFQMDNKVGGLSRDVLAKAMDQARQGRLHILGKMAEVIEEPRAELSTYAPRVITLQIPVDRIRDLIGPGGRVIQEIQAEADCKIDVSDDGTVIIYAISEEMSKEALRRVKFQTQDAEVGALYNGTVTGVKDFGAFVRIFANTEGLCHISEIAKERINKVTDVLNEGDEVLVRVLDVDRQGKIRLSRKAALDADPSEEIK
ncbi:polyribonucleotide nucleotidyltransferase [Thermodesulfobacteriota bacterium]